jgi:hypothetical protein
LLAKFLEVTHRFQDCIIHSKTNPHKHSSIHFLLKDFKRKPTQEELSGIFKNMIKKFKHSITLMAEIKPDLTPITNYLVWKNDTETNLIDKYLPKEFKDRPYQICRTNEICAECLNFLIIFLKIPLNSS